jgi:hypothetical protein
MPRFKTFSITGFDREKFAPDGFQRHARIDRLGTSTIDKPSLKNHHRDQARYDEHQRK